MCFSCVYIFIFTYKYQQLLNTPEFTTPIQDLFFKKLKDKELEFTHWTFTQKDLHIQKRLSKTINFKGDLEFKIQTHQTELIYSLKEQLQIALQLNEPPETIASLGLRLAKAQNHDAKTPPLELYRTLLILAIFSKGSEILAPYQNTPISDRDPSLTDLSLEDLRYFHHLAVANQASEATITELQTALTKQIKLFQEQRKAYALTFSF